MEMNNPSFRPALADISADITGHDVVFVGFPKMEYGFDCVSCV